jgi:hypothetical protein
MSPQPVISKVWPTLKPSFPMGGDGWARPTHPATSAMFKAAVPVGGHLLDGSAHAAVRHIGDDRSHERPAAELPPAAALSLAEMRDLHAKPIHRTR